MARTQGGRVGFTPTARLLKYLLPLYNAKKGGSGASSKDVLLQELEKIPELRSWRLPTLTQLDRWWASENARKGRALIGIGSRVVIPKMAPKLQKKPPRGGGGGGGGGSGGKRRQRLQRLQRRQRRQRRRWAR
jgi:hypothetical protein